MAGRAAEKSVSISSFHVSTAANHTINIIQRINDRASFKKTNSVQTLNSCNTWSKKKSTQPNRQTETRNLMMTCPPSVQCGGAGLPVPPSCLPPHRCKEPKSRTKNQHPHADGGPLNDARNVSGNSSAIFPVSCRLRLILPTPHIRVTARRPRAQSGNREHKGKKGDKQESSNQEELDKATTAARTGRRRKNGTQTVFASVARQLLCLWYFLRD